MKIKELFKFKKTDYREMGSNIFDFWSKSYKIIFFIVFLAAAFLGAYLCYAFLFQPGTGLNKNNAASGIQSQNVEFKEDDFNKLVDLVQKKRSNYSATYQPVKDIFQPYK